jgi:hypothetical protein
MSAEPPPDYSAFSEFADTLQEKRVLSEQVVRRALTRAKAHYPVRFADELNDVSRAVEELHVQNFTEETDEDLF